NLVRRFTQMAQNLSLGNRVRTSAEREKMKPRTWRRLGLAGPVLCLLCPMFGQSAQQPTLPALPLLTRAEQVRQLSADQAERGYPVRLRGVVTYFDAQSPDLFIQNSTAGTWVALGDTGISWETGHIVRADSCRSGR